jgi:hypothetical protein
VNVDVEKMSKRAQRNHGADLDDAQAGLESRGWGLPTFPPEGFERAGPIMYQAALRGVRVHGTDRASLIMAALGWEDEQARRKPEFRSIELPADHPLSPHYSRLVEADERVGDDDVVAA